MQRKRIYEVMPKKCKSCPFNTDKNGRHPCPRLVSEIQRRILTEASQICHHPVIYSQPETHLCRGARDFQLEMFYRLGVIDAPTDEAWESKRSIRCEA